MNPFGSDKLLYRKNFLIHSADMVGKWLHTIKDCLTYWRALVSDALALSGKIGGFGAKVWSFLIAIIPSGIAAAIGVNSHFTFQQWIWYPSGIFVLWIMVLMLVSAFRNDQTKNQRITKLEEDRKIKLSIERITCQHFAGRGVHCRVTIRNTSPSAIADNVHVRMSGEVLPNIFREGYNPFHDQDLIPASGCRAINPDSEADWLFNDDFNTLIDSLNSRSFVKRQIHGNSHRPDVQEFLLTVSGSASPPLRVRFSAEKGQGWDNILFTRL